ncbi:hypothetical protein, partial [Plesiomonas shigelloides]|uniref:hypothetical protein n=1 Tax=Plesiomonas shigelloides TaxID=703 RepID=UPI001C49A4D4
GHKIHVVNAHFKMSLLELFVIREFNALKTLSTSTDSNQLNPKLSSKIPQRYNTVCYITV